MVPFAEATGEGRREKVALRENGEASTKQEGRRPVQQEKGKVEKLVLWEKEEGRQLMMQEKGEGGS